MQVEMVRTETRGATTTVLVGFAAGETIEAVSCGKTVVEVMTVDVFDPTGQLTTYGGHEVIVYSTVLRIVDVLNGASLVTEVESEVGSGRVFATGQRVV
jgi:hypothetical protein